MIFKTLKSLESKIKEQVSTIDRQAIKALLSIYEYQTAQEQDLGATLKDNGEGFRACDADFLTSLAKQYLSRGTLTERQLMFLKKKMSHYSGQLLRHAREKGLYKKTEQGWETT